MIDEALAEIFAELPSGPTAEHNQSTSSEGGLSSAWAFGPADVAVQTEQQQTATKNKICTS